MLNFVVPFTSNILCKNGVPEWLLRSQLGMFIQILVCRVIHGALVELPKGTSRKKQEAAPYIHHMQLKHPKDTSLSLIFLSCRCY
jgi:hypothetical protein